MRVTIKTSVKSSLVDVKEGFTRDLFLKLNPPFPLVSLKQFDGCKKGNVVHLELDFLLFKQEWVSLVTLDEDKQNEWLFIDEGQKLPFFLKTWSHRHAVVKNAESGSVIIDDFTYSTGTLLTDILLYPALFLQFVYRKPIYKRIFK